jgi:CP family cyanate transporter-like MFS transporter
MMLSIGYIIAAAGPGLLGLVHDATGAWTAPVLVLLAITLLELVPGVRAARAGVLRLESAQTAKKTVSPGP